MRKSTKDIPLSEKMLQVTDNLYIKVVIDPNQYRESDASSNLPFFYWEGKTAEMENSCQDAIGVIYKVLGTLPVAGERIANGKDPRTIDSVIYRVYGENVAAWFECS